MKKRKMKEKIKNLKWKVEVLQDERDWWDGQVCELDQEIVRIKVLAFDMLAEKG